MPICASAVCLVADHCVSMVMDCFQATEMKDRYAAHGARSRMQSSKA